MAAAGLVAAASTVEANHVPDPDQPEGWFPYTQASDGMSNCGTCTRYHIRLWNVPAAENPLKSVGDAHHEDWVNWAPWNPCGFPGSGSHAVDANGSDGSGFDQGRRATRNGFAAAGHDTSVEYWGNTRNFEQCDNDMAGSNGNGAIIGVWHNH